MLNPDLENQISPATLTDLTELDRIERAAFSTPWSPELIRAAVHNKQYDVRVLRTAREPVTGFYIAHMSQDKSNLDNLAVEETLRGLGYGSHLILDWIGRAAARKASRLALQVNTRNFRARKLYKEFDFRVTSMLVSYYPNGEDAYQMERALA